jgi:hypothetical protein
LKRYDPGGADLRRLRERLSVLALSRTRVLGQLSAATEANYRAMLERAVAALDAEAEELTTRAAAPDLRTDAGAAAAPHPATRSS